MKKFAAATATGIITTIPPIATAQCQAEAPEWKVMVYTLKERHLDYRWSMANRLLL